MDDLKLMPTEKIMDELLSRFDHVIFCGIRIDKGDVTTIRRWRGNCYTAAGLCDSVQKSILDHAHKIETRIDLNDM